MNRYINVVRRSVIPAYLVPSVPSCPTESFIFICATLGCRTLSLFPPPSSHEKGWFFLWYSSLIYIIIHFAYNNESTVTMNHCSNVLIVSWIHLLKWIGSVRTPGLPAFAHPLPQDTIPARKGRPVAGLMHMNGPPLSPCGQRIR